MPSIKAIKIALRLGPDNWQFTAVACALGALTFARPYFVLRLWFLES